MKMTFKQILNSKDFSTISDEIQKLYKEAQKYKDIMRHAKSQLQFSMHECFLQLTQEKINKLESA